MSTPYRILDRQRRSDETLARDEVAEALDCPGGGRTTCAGSSSSSPWRPLARLYLRRGEAGLAERLAGCFEIVDRPVDPPATIRARIGPDGR